ncbi:MAG: hypothetical protein L0I84_01975, partial [Halomonas subglaciescola]|nr:hypothetical protein [Halomonas subglaciescola]
ILNEGKKTLATAPIEVVEAEVEIFGPAIVRAGNEVDISWTETISGYDIVTIVPAGADKGAYNNHLRAKENVEGRLRAPAEPGLYELRYILNEGKQMLASAPLEVVGKDAPLDDGAGLSVPKNATPGETISVSWTGENDSADQRIAIARKDQADFSWIAVESVGEEKTLDMTLPDEAGYYEIRYLDVTGRKLLGRSVVTVE